MQSISIPCDNGHVQAFFRSHARIYRCVPCPNRSHRLQQHCCSVHLICTSAAASHAVSPAPKRLCGGSCSERQARHRKPYRSTLPKPRISFADGRIKSMLGGEGTNDGPLSACKDLSNPGTGSLAAHIPCCRKAKKHRSTARKLPAASSLVPNRTDPALRPSCPTSINITSTTCL